MAKAKKEKPVTQHWQALVETYFVFCEKVFSERPSFDGSTPRDLKSIVDELERRAKFNDQEWTSELACKMLESFLVFAYKDSFLKNNFLLFNINRQKDKIFFAIKQRKLSNPNADAKKDYILYQNMLTVYKRSFKNYEVVDDDDLPSCLDIAFYIADRLKLDRALLYDSQELMLNRWEYIVSWVSCDPWYSSRTITELRKDWQRLNQKIDAKYPSNKGGIVKSSPAGSRARL